MFARLIQLCSAFLFASALTASSPALAGNDGMKMASTVIASITSSVKVK
jgi:hypothetical protein